MEERGVMQQHAAALPALERTNLAETTAGLIRERILLGAFAPGERLVESEIARQLKTSRGPVREALAMLRAEDLAYEEPGRGTFAMRLGPQDIKEIYEVRAALESGAAKMVIENQNGDAVDAMDAAVDRMRAAASAGDSHAFIEADLEMHRELCTRAGNARLAKMWESQTQLLRTLVRLEVNRLVGPSFEPVLGQHERLAREIRAGDLARATHATWALFKSTSSVLTDGMETEG